MNTRVEVYFSLQSDYCYFLIDRLLELQARGIDLMIRPVLGGVLRLPDRYRDRDTLEQQYFSTDTQRTAAYLGLPYAYPDPSPIEFKPDSLWIAAEEQPRNTRLNRLFVGAVQVGKGAEFLNHVVRRLWDGSTPGWDRGDHLQRYMAEAGMVMQDVLDARPESVAVQVLDTNAQAILNAGHWGVPLMVYKDEPFYGQDRFDQLVWRLREQGDLSC